MPYFYDDFFAREGAGDENDPTIDAAKAIAQIRERSDFDFDLLVVSERTFSEFGRLVGRS